MKICMLATCHKVEDGRIFHKEAKTLSRDHDVKIIANGTETKLYSKDGITIKAHKGELVAKNYPPRFLKLFLEGFRTDADVYHCHEPGSLLIGVALSKLKGKKVVYDVHENWGSVTSTASVIFSKIKPLVEPYVILMENLLAPHADYVISVSESVQGRLVAHNDKHTIVYNYPLLSESCGPYDVPKEFDCVYTGAVREARGSAVLFDVASMDPSMKFNIIGETTMPGLPNVTVTDWVPYEQLEAESSKSKIGLILFQPNVYNNTIGLPQKLFEYMQCGIPVIAPDFPEIRRVVNEANCGILVDTTDPDSIYKGIRTLKDDPVLYKTMSQNARKFIEEKFNWATQEWTLRQVYSEIES